MDEKIGQQNGNEKVYCYAVSGKAARDRIVPLLPKEWVEYGSSSDSSTKIPDFLWENAPRHETKRYRDVVKCYSHLPNGISLLDDKWKLARFTSSYPQFFLPSYCFRGKDAFRQLYTYTLRPQLTKEQSSATSSPTANESLPLLDLDTSYSTPSLSSSQEETHAHSNINDNTRNHNNHMWVIKDANANGAGGIWVVNDENAKDFFGDGSSKTASPLMENHRYVCQQYAWPLVLYQGRKCHVRVYGLVTSNHQVYLHKRAFLHVANQPFNLTSNPNRADVHITNCCANSQDADLFAGEICADLTSNENTESIVGLADFFPSMKQSIALLMQTAMPFLKGGDANCGFEYLGLDFILSCSSAGKKHAYLLEINCPPSQDTATGLPHAEDLHNTVLQDLINLWVIPNVVQTTTTANNKNKTVSKLGGWIPIYSQTQRQQVQPSTNIEPTILPSKAMIINKLRWTFYERKLIKEQLILQQQQQISNDNHNYNYDAVQKKDEHEDWTNWVQHHYPYFHSTNQQAPHVTRHNKQIFLENAGGAQVPNFVIEHMTSSLSHRNRCDIGYSQKQTAQECIQTILGIPSSSANSHYKITFGSNATALLHQLANAYSDILPEQSEIIIASENHQAHVTPWIRLAQQIKHCKVKWWTMTNNKNYMHTQTFMCEESSCDLKELLTEKTKIVAISHCSNVLGYVRNIQSICQLVKQTSKEAHIIVDGVAAVPHTFANLSNSGVDWYVISCHKLFGPHLGVMCGLNQHHQQLCFSDMGTCNYEACAGIQGLAQYFTTLANHNSSKNNQHDDRDEEEGEEQQHGERSTREARRPSLSTEMVRNVYRQISIVETRIVKYVLSELKECPHICVLEDQSFSFLEKRVPVISFYHRQISSRDIVQKCLEQDIICRHGTFLTNKVFQEEFGIDSLDDGFVRLSFVHYNKLSEARRTMQVLKLLDNWK